MSPEENSTQICQSNEACGRLSARKPGKTGHPLRRLRSPGTPRELRGGLRRKPEKPGKSRALSQRKPWRNAYPRTSYLLTYICLISLSRTPPPGKVRLCYVPDFLFNHVPAFCRTTRRGPASAVLAVSCRTRSLPTHPSGPPTLNEIHPRTRGEAR